ncbi:MAG: hypothetical protein AAGF07_01500 [Patescibacteria group bacterium]
MSEKPYNFNYLRNSNKSITENAPDAINEVLKSPHLENYNRDEKLKMLKTAFEFGDKFLDDILNKYPDCLEIEPNPEIKDLLSRFPNLAMLIVRPEMYHIAWKIENFLSQQNLEIIDTLNIKISYKQYLSICRESIKVPAAKFSMPTRTMVYTGGLSKIILCKTKNKQEVLSDKLVDSLKGKGGVQDSNHRTIRGGIVHNEAIKLGFHELNDPEIRSAIDPIGVLRLITEFPEYQTKLAKSVVIPYLRLVYSAVAVHIPNSQEIAKDLSSINCSEWIQNVFNKM